MHRDAAVQAMRERFDVKHSVDGRARSLERGEREAAEWLEGMVWSTVGTKRAYQPLVISA